LPGGQQALVDDFPPKCLRHVVCAGFDGNWVKLRHGERQGPQHDQNDPKGFHGAVLLNYAFYRLEFFMHGFGGLRNAFAVKAAVSLSIVAFSSDAESSAVTPGNSNSRSTSAIRSDCHAPTLGIMAVASSSVGKCPEHGGSLSE